MIAVTHTLGVPAAEVRYDIRQSEPPGAPVLVTIGSPLGAAGLRTLATHFTDHTIVAYDLRGGERSECTDRDPDVTPEVHAGDVGAVIEAVNALALVAAQPNGVRTLVAHEPPMPSVVRRVPVSVSALAGRR